jgi:hypothetical protein
VLAITRSNDLFLERGKQGLSLEPFGRGGQLSAKWSGRKKRKLLTSETDDSTTLGNCLVEKSFLQKNHILLHLINKIGIRFEAFFRGEGISSLSKFSPNCFGQKRGD